MGDVVKKDSGVEKGTAANPRDATVPRGDGPGGDMAGDGRRSRWTGHRQQRREEFIQAALRVLAKFGPDLPIEAVAAEAGVSKPVLYRYFNDKAALVEALGEAGSAALLDRMLPAMQSDRPPLERVRDTVGAYFALIDEQPNLYWLLARWPGSESVQRDKDLIATALTAILGDYLRVFGLDSGGAEPWAYGLTGLVQSTGEWWLTRRSMSRVHVVGYVTELIWAALSGVLRDSGVVIDPARPLPPIRPQLTLHQAHPRRSADDTVPTAMMQDK
ncbi:MAG TPA: TetR/AcrR family transcriptional regulator [Streptosporangiaceae bacterium]|nr:TetR/AcrR family transcriptional regulator [Streptosporangiaceae bacterium]